MSLSAKEGRSHFRFAMQCSCTLLVYYLKIITGFSDTLANLAADAVVYENV